MPPSLARRNCRLHCPHIKITPLEVFCPLRKVSAKAVTRVDLISPPSTAWYCTHVQRSESAVSLSPLRNGQSICMGVVRSVIINCTAVPPFGLSRKHVFDALYDCLFWFGRIITIFGEDS